MRILALDLSLTRTGFTMDDGRCGTLTPPRGEDRGPRRLRWIRDHVINLAKLNRTELALIEGYAFGAKGNAVFDIAELGGVIRLALLDAGIPYLVLPPATVKKFATGSGNANKELMLTQAVRVLGYCGADNNEADALWMHTMAKVAYDPEFDLALPVAQLRVVDSVTWPNRDNTQLVLPPRKPRAKVATGADDLFGAR